MPWKNYATELILSAATLVSANGWFQSRRQRKAQEAQLAEAASHQNIENAKLVVEMNRDYVVKPLQEEVLLVRKEIKGLRREVARFRSAVERVTTCQYSAECPVVKELEKQRGDEEVN